MTLSNILNKRDRPTDPETKRVLKIKEMKYIPPKTKRTYFLDWRRPAILCQVAQVQHPYVTYITALYCTVLFCTVQYFTVL